MVSVAEQTLKEVDVDALAGRADRPSSGQESGTLQSSSKSRKRRLS